MTNRGIPSFLFANEVNLTHVESLPPIEEVNALLAQMWRRGILVDTLIVNSAQLEEMREWKIPKADISRPINFDFARLRIRVEHTLPQPRGKNKGELLN